MFIINLLIAEGWKKAILGIGRCHYATFNSLYYNVNVVQHIIIITIHNTVAAENITAEEGVFVLVRKVLEKAPSVKVIFKKRQQNDYF